MKLHPADPPGNNTAPKRIKSREEAVMKKIAALVIAGTFVCGAGPRLAQQDKNPDQQQQQVQQPQHQGLA